MKLRPAKDAHEVAYQDLAKLLRKHATDITSLELLAVAANMVGKILAMQDQTTTTPEAAMKVIAENLEHGNRQVVEALKNNIGGTQ
jgi:hypothetical protein